MIKTSDMFSFPKIGGASQKRNFSTLQEIWENQTREKNENREFMVKLSEAALVVFEKLRLYHFSGKCKVSPNVDQYWYTLELKMNGKYEVAFSGKIRAH